MSQKEVVARGYEAFNAGDIERSLTIFDPAIEWHTDIVPGPGGGTYHGFAAPKVLRSLLRRCHGTNMP